MSFKYPTIIRNNSETVIAIDDVYNSQSNDCTMVEIGLIIDIDEDGREIGLELLNLKLVLGVNIITSAIWESQQFQCSYDYESDSFYLHLAPSNRSVDQRVIDGFALLDEKKTLIGFKYSSL